MHTAEGARSRRLPRTGQTRARTDETGCDVLQPTSSGCLPLARLGSGRPLQPNCPGLVHGAVRGDLYNANMFKIDTSTLFHGTIASQERNRGVCSLNKGRDSCHRRYTAPGSQAPVIMRCLHPMLFKILCEGGRGRSCSGARLPLACSPVEVQ